MVPQKRDIDILESVLRRRGALLDILLLDKTTNKNILWATDSYEHKGKGFGSKNHIQPDLVTGEYRLLIQPRAAKSLEEQRRRTKDKAEVFTPKDTVDQINRATETYSINQKNWKVYVSELELEITCGEAPFIVTRYNPTAHGVLIKIANRVGFLDRKLRVVSKYCEKKSDWLYWAKEAFKASYGYEWQGDNVLIARENLLYTFIDYYVSEFGHRPGLKLQEELAEIISWNIFQMDGLRYVVPMSCKHKSEVVPGEWTLFEKQPDRIEERECEGCRYNRPYKHNGKYVKVMDWGRGQAVRFVDLLDQHSIT